MCIRTSGTGATCGSGSSSAGQCGSGGGGPGGLHRGGRVQREAWQFFEVFTSTYTRTCSVDSFISISDQSGLTLRHEARKPNL